MADIGLKYMAGAIMDTDRKMRNPPMNRDSSLERW